MSEIQLRRTSRGDLLAGAPTIRAALAVLDQVASSNCTVLVTGESGTGKELAVAALHDASPRAGKPLIAVNCGAIPENLVESELFGHVRGAFTGASAHRVGLVAAAESGTLFLDEVGELPLSAQVKLLRLLQSREYTVVGDTRPQKSDVRIVAATNRDLPAEIRKGRFREDLFHRLNVIHVELPALRHRRDDIVPLARHFLATAAERAGRHDVVGFSDEALRRIQGGEWAGNVRALENAVERGVLLSVGPLVEAHTILAAPPPVLHPLLRPSGVPVRHLTMSVPPPPPIDSERTIDLRATVEAYETQIVRKVLEAVDWNRSRAARKLGIQRTTLIDLIRRKGLQPRADRAA